MGITAPCNVYIRITQNIIQFKIRKTYINSSIQPSYKVWTTDNAWSWLVHANIYTIWNTDTPDTILWRSTSPHQEWSVPPSASVIAFQFKDISLWRKSNAQTLVAYIQGIHMYMNVDSQWVAYITDGWYLYNYKGTPTGMTFLGVTDRYCW